MNPEASPHAARQGGAPTAQVISLGDLHDNGRGHPLPQPVSPIHSVKAKLEVFVGSGSMSVGELLSAREGQVVVLDTGLNDPVELRLGGHVVARGRLVAVDGRFALRVTELPVLLKA